MTSTRNSNTQNDYNVDKRQSINIQNYMLYNGYANSFNPSLFNIGSNPSFYSGLLSQNNIDIESKLRGINSTNLEGPSFNPSPQLRSVPVISYFERPKVFMPLPFNHSKEQRPNYLG
jgi:hypothetical protein